MVQIEDRSVRELRGDHVKVVTRRGTNISLATTFFENERDNTVMNEHLRLIAKLWIQGH